MSVSAYAHRDVVTIGPQDSIDRAIVLMEEHNLHHLPVVEEGALVGIVSDRDVLLSVGWNLRRQRLAVDYDPIDDAHPSQVHEIMTRGVVQISSDQPVRHAARLMTDRRIGALPVLSAGRMTGILTETDLMRQLLAAAARGGVAQEVAARRVPEVMRSSVQTVKRTTPLQQLVDTIQRRHIRHLPVVEEDAVVGMISDRDVRRALGQARWNPREPDPLEPLRASDIMSRDVKSVGLHHRLSDAAERMLQFRIHALPVCDERGRLLGIVSQTDIVLEIAKADVL